MPANHTVFTEEQTREIYAALEYSHSVLVNENMGTEAVDDALAIIKPKLDYWDGWHAAPICPECGGAIGYTCDCDEDR